MWEPCTWWCTIYCEYIQLRDKQKIWLHKASKLLKYLLETGMLTGVEAIQIQGSKTCERMNEARSCQGDCMWQLQPDTFVQILFWWFFSCLQKLQIFHHTNITEKCYILITIWLLPRSECTQNKKIWILKMEIRENRNIDSGPLVWMCWGFTCISYLLKKKIQGLNQ